MPGALPSAAFVICLGTAGLARASASGGMTFGQMADHEVVEAE